MANTEDIPRIARRAWDEWKAAMKDELTKERESAGFWVGGKHQWRAGEVESREGKNRPWMTINRCEPVVSQVENEARQNPPGPQAHPVGGGADKDGADTLEGLIREYEYRCDAQNSYIMALRNGCARMRGAFDIGTEYVSERSMEQQVIVKGVPNPEACFYDPNATAPCREDAMWQGEVLRLSRQQLEEQYGHLNLKVLNRGVVSNLVAGIGGWMQDALGWKNDLATLSEWTGNGNPEGPFYVCVYWRVEIKQRKLTLYSDHILRFDDEKVPAGVTPKLDSDGDVIERSSPVRKIRKYLLTALDELDCTEWAGDLIPRFWVLGPEMWIDGKVHRHSLLSGALDSQRLLNYAVTSAAETVGTMSKAPFIGVVGQFDTPNAQGINPWDNANGVLYPYLEVKPVFMIDEITGASVPAPPPQRNTWEAPIERLLELANFAVEMIKGATSVFFEPSLPAAQKAQSGAAIRALQSQSNIGTLNWQDALHRAVGLSYQQAAQVMASLYDSERVRTIVKPDNSHEIATINKEFGGNVVEHKGQKRNNIIDGQYSLRVTAGPNFQTRQEQSISQLMDAFKIIPQLLGMPGIAAQFLRMLGQGNPQIEQMADALMPGGPVGDNPQALQAQFAQAQSENQQLKGVLQQMQQAIAAKLPEQETKKWVAALNAIAGIREAEIKAGVDQSGNDVRMLENLTGLAHDAATQAADHEHERGMQASQQQAQQQAQVADQAHATATQQSDQQATAEQQQAAQSAQGDE